MTEPSGGDWSRPSLYAGGAMFEPRTFTEADPISSVFFTDWADVPAPHEPQWSAPTYVGRRNLRPGTKPAAATIDAARGTTEAAADEGTSGLLATSRTMAVASLASRITGFLRSVLLVAALGTGAVGNSYSAGNTFPNMVYELLLGGVLSSVLIPLLVHAQSEDEDDGVGYTQRLLSIAAAVLGVLTIAAVAAAPLIAGAFVPPGSQRGLTSLFATLLLPEIFFYGLGAMFMAILNIKHVYRPGAWAPVLNNVIMIFTVLVFWALPGPNTLNPANMTTAQILVLGLGTTLGIAAQALVLIPALRKVGFHWQWRFRARPNEIGRMKEVGSLAGWVLGYVLASQVGVTVIQKIGISNGGLTVFTQADLLFQMPYGILVVSLLTAIMPRMSRAAVRGDNAAVIEDLTMGSRLSAAALLPITALLMVLGIPLGVTLFAHGQTSLDGAELIGSSLALSAFGLVPFAIVMLQLRVFYALRDGKTPTLINIFMVCTKVVLVLVTNEIFRAPKGTKVNIHPSAHAVEWLAISTSLSYVVGAIVGHVLLTKRLGHLGMASVLSTGLKVGLASAVGAAGAYAVLVALQNTLGHGFAGSAAGLVVGGVVGLVVFGVVAWQMRIPEIRQLATLGRGR
ncbi:MAG: putative peptidoglycan lipid flippase [Pseudonocardiales bacterium]|nr:putative peptidoglycan lipid flippase [Pseudonocardiales bacterium]